ncbi:MAG TPA: fluoride efflux transporter CrcB [Chloroflexia bacterium]|nr:fluoride efflux transporter CrcB [Chloroflexia bacterium]
MREFFIISIGAALGANARYFLTLWFVKRYGATFPWGTLVINVSGSFAIGLILTILGQRLVSEPGARLLLVTGFLGAYTTFSAFSYETLALLQQGAYPEAAYNVLSSVALSLFAAFAGILLARLIT